MKKLFCVLVIIICLCSLSACKVQNSSGVTSTDQTAGTDGINQTTVTPSDTTEKTDELIFGCDDECPKHTFLYHSIDSFWFDAIGVDKVSRWCSIFTVSEEFSHAMLCDYFGIPKEIYTFWYEKIEIPYNQANDADVFVLSPKVVFGNDPVNSP